MSLPEVMSPKISQWVKPSLETRWHIDYDWWKREERDLRIYLLSHLCPEHRAVFSAHVGNAQVDWIDPQTAEVRRVDGLQHALRTHCSLEPDYLTSHTSLVDAVFRVFLANGNQPLNSRELSQQIGRDANTILRTLSAGRVYKGLRPVTDTQS